LFITFEGVEGCGKSTLAAMLDQHLQNIGKSTFLLREPGSTDVGEKIRAILKDKSHVNLTNECEALLFLAARAQVVGELIWPYFGLGVVVIADRFFDSTIAYQGHASGVDVDDLIAINKFATKDLTPDITFLIDLDPAIGLARKANQGEIDRIEEKGIEYQQKVAEGYKMQAREHPGRIKVINGEQSIEDIFAEVLKHLEGRECDGYGALCEAVQP